MKKKNYQFTIECIDGGCGWGETGQKGYIVVEEKVYQDAKLHVRKSLPGGWRYQFECMTDKFPCLNPHVISK